MTGRQKIGLIGIALGFSIGLLPLVLHFVTQGIAGGAGCATFDRIAEKCLAYNSGLVWTLYATFVGPGQSYLPITVIVGVGLVLLGFALAFYQSSERQEE